MDFDAIIEGAKPAERTAELCLRPDLVAQIEDVQRRIAKERDRPRTSLADGGQGDELRAELESLRDTAREYTIVFRFRALNPYRLRQLITDSPPREGNDQDKRFGYNTDQLTYRLIRECCYEPELSDEQWEKLIGPDDRIGDGTLSPSQWQRLDAAVESLNFARTDVPFS